MEGGTEEGGSQPKKKDESLHWSSKVLTMRIKKTREHGDRQTWEDLAVEKAGIMEVGE